MSTPADVLAFWRSAGEKAWFAKDEAFDAKCRGFEALHFAAARGELADWERTSEGALALLILLDQIPRNIYRGAAHMFATDPLALGVAQRALDAKHDQAVDPKLRVFFYLPFEHAEDIAQQARGVALFEAMGDPNQTKWAYLHRDIIARFGRFPHRNAALGRVTTPDEQQFLDSGGFKG